MQTSRRPETREDDAFVRSLILETVADELGAATWPEPMRAQLLDIQLNGRRQAGESYILQADGIDCGWLLLRTLPEEIRIVEIMVSPDMRGCGIGAAAIQDVLATANKPVRLNVNVTNHRAIRLYERLGFRRTEGNEIQQLMEYAAPRL